MRNNKTMYIDRSDIKGRLLMRYTDLDNERERGESVHLNVLPEEALNLIFNVFSKTWLTPSKTRGGLGQSVPVRFYGLIMDRNHNGLYLIDDYKDKGICFPGDLYNCDLEDDLDPEQLLYKILYYSLAKILHPTFDDFWCSDYWGKIVEILGKSGFSVGGRNKSLYYTYDRLGLTIFIPVEVQPRLNVTGEFIYYTKSQHIQMERHRSDNIRRQYYGSEGFDDVRVGDLDDYDLFSYIFGTEGLFT